MECKNCKNDMEEVEQGTDDGMITIERTCNSCKWKSKSWYDLDECLASNTSWIDAKGDSQD